MSERLHAAVTSRQTKGRVESSRAERSRGGRRRTLSHRRRSATVILGTPGRLILESSVLTRVVGRHGRPASKWHSFVFVVRCLPKHCIASGRESTLPELGCIRHDGLSPTYAGLYLPCLAKTGQSVRNRAVCRRQLITRQLITRLRQLISCR